MRTRLHVLREQARVELARHESALHVLFEPAHGYGRGVRHPRGAPGLGVLELEDRHERVRLHPRQAAARERSAQLVRLLACPFEPQQRVCLARRHPEPLAREHGQTGTASKPAAPRPRDLEQQRADLGEPALLDPQRTPQPRIEVDRIRGFEAQGERREEGRRVQRTVG